MPPVQSPEQRPSTSLPRTGEGLPAGVAGSGSLYQGWVLFSAQTGSKERQAQSMERFPFHSSPSRPCEAAPEARQASESHCGMPLTAVDGPGET